MLCPYCACMSTLLWRTMFQEEVFLFVARKSPFPFFERKNGSFCEVTTKMPFQNATVPFSYNTRPPYMYYLPTRTSQTFLSIRGKKDKCLPNRQEVGPVCT